MSEGALPAVRINGLNLAQGYPQPKGNNVAKNYGRTEKRGNLEDQDLSPVGIGRRESNGSSVLMVNVVNLLVTPTVVQKPMDLVIGVILHQKVDQQLSQDLSPRRQWQPSPDPDHLKSK